MSIQPLVTILTASLNNGSTLGWMLESIKRQTFQNFEHIVCDGGSTDQTLPILKAYEDAYPLQWFSAADYGIADALNKGLSQAKGIYILVLHADDCLISDRTLEHISHYLHKETFDLYCFPVKIEHPDGQVKVFYPLRPIWWYHLKSIFPHQGCFVHRRVHEEVGGYNTTFSIAMDYEFFYRVLQTQPRIRYGRHYTAIMQGSGISSALENLAARLREEIVAQKLNEKKTLWRIAQTAFRLCYQPYKLWVMPKLKI